MTRAAAIEVTDFPRRPRFGVYFSDDEMQIEIKTSDAALLSPVIELCRTRCPDAPVFYLNAQMEYVAITSDGEVIEGGGTTNAANDCDT